MKKAPDWTKQKRNLITGWPYNRRGDERSIERNGTREYREMKYRNKTLEKLTPLE